MGPWRSKNPSRAPMYWSQNAAIIRFLPILNGHVELDEWHAERPMPTGGVRPLRLTRKSTFARCARRRAIAAE
jgi:hypothetical protein